MRDCMHPVIPGVNMTAQVMLDFALSEQIYAKARVADVSSVALWLGADVMLEYPLDEAKQLLVREDFDYQQPLLHGVIGGMHVGMHTNK